MNPSRLNNTRFDGTLYHGTSLEALRRIRTREPIQLVYQTHNPSLGGAYFTTNQTKGWGHAELAAFAHKSKPILLAVEPDELHPDEDWVVPAFDNSELEDDETIKDPALNAFFGDLFVNYYGESLSDHYKTRYHELNKSHGITAAHSLQWAQSARQLAPLYLGQIVAIFPNLGRSHLPLFTPIELNMSPANHSPDQPECSPNKTDKTGRKSS